MIKWFRNDNVPEALKLITRMNALASEVQTAAARETISSRVALICVYSIA